MNREIFLKYLNNCCSEAELSEFFTWLNSDHSDDFLIGISKSEWQSLSVNPAESGFKKSELILDKIHQAINKSKNPEVDFKSEDEKLNCVTSNVTFSDESSDQITELMSSSTPNNNKVLHKEISEDEIYSNQQIITTENI